MQQTQMMGQKQGLNAGVSARGLRLAFSRARTSVRAQSAAAPTQVAYKAAQKPFFPFVRIAGQEEMKLALMLNVVDPNIGGVLIVGDRGTGKSVAVSVGLSHRPRIGEEQMEDHAVRTMQSAMRPHHPASQARDSVRCMPRRVWMQLQVLQMSCGRML